MAEHTPDLDKGADSPEAWVAFGRRWVHAADQVITGAICEQRQIGAELVGLDSVAAAQEVVLAAADALAAAGYPKAGDPSIVKLAHPFDIFRAQHHRLFPDVAPQIDALDVIDSDEHSWLKGAVTPTVRKPVARTDSGGLLVAIGDTAIAVDPIAGQGAQLGAIQVAALADALREETGEWDEELFKRLFDAHWEGHGKPSVEATSLFLGDPKYAEVVGSFFGRAAENPAAGTALFDLLSVPGPVLGLRGKEDVDRFVRTFEERGATVSA